MWMGRARINLEARLNETMSQFVAFQHAQDGFFENKNRIAFAHRRSWTLFESAGVASVPSIELVLPLVAGELDLLGLGAQRIVSFFLRVL